MLIFDNFIDIRLISCIFRKQKIFFYWNICCFLTWFKLLLNYHIFSWFKDFTSLASIWLVIWLAFRKPFMLYSNEHPIFQNFIKRENVDHNLIRPHSFEIFQLMNGFGCWLLWGIIIEYSCICIVQRVKSFISLVSPNWGE